MREAFDIHQPRRKLRQNFEHPFRLVRHSKALWDFLRIFIRASYRSDPTHHKFSQKSLPLILTFTCIKLDSLCELCKFSAVSAVQSFKVDAHHDCYPRKETPPSLP